MIIVPLSQESTHDAPVRVEIDAERSEGTVGLRVPPDVKYPDYPRVLMPDEARAIAAALLHYADECER